MLIPYRNRGKEVVQKCLQALQVQDYPDFEVILLDYGSHEEISQEINTLCAKYDRVHYVYSDARGYFWSCSQAFNQALGYARGVYLLMLDVDLIVPTYFLNFCLENCAKTEFLIFKVLYLPQDFKEWNLLSLQPEKYLHQEHSDYGGLGNIFVKKEYFLQTGGYDTFYRVWGEEDRDMVRQLEKVGLKPKKIEPGQLPIFHQWHPKVSASLPKGWQKTILAHSQKKTKRPASDVQLDFKPTPIYQCKDRPVLNQLDPQKWADEAQFQFDFPVEQSYVQFIKCFEELEPRASLCISQRFSEIRPQQGSRLGNVLTKTNKLLKSWKISYRLVEIAQSETEIIYASAVADYLFYFLLEFEEQIEDYYFEAKGDTVFLVVVKK